MRRDECRDAVKFCQQHLFIPMGVENLHHRLGVSFAAGFQLIQLVGDEPLRFDRDRRARILSEFQFAVLQKQRIRAPRHEMKFIGIRMQIDEKVVIVAGVSVPKPEQTFGCPEPIERI